MPCRRPTPTALQPPRVGVATVAVAVLSVSLALAGACAPKPVPVATVSAPRFPDYIQPAVPPTYVGTPVASAQTRGWTLLQAGDLKNAEREFTTALKTVPAFFPAEAGLGWVAMAGRIPKDALPHFDRALEMQPADVSALMGRAQALLALNRTNEALAAFRAALAADPSLPEVRQRIEVLSFRTAEQNVADARAAARARKFDEAIQAYTAAIASSPDSPFLYRELAAVERQKGNAAAALDHFRKAASLDPGDAHTFEQIGELLEESGDFEAAEKAYSDSLALDASPSVERRLEELREKMELARLPAEYRAIDQAAQITRGDLAALIGVRLAPLLDGSHSRDAALITDLRNHWAATWIMAVARAGVMEPFANHAFQPRAVVRRTDLAQAAARLLARIAANQPGERPAWESVRLKFSDLSPGHLAYPAASMAVAAGVMKTAAGDAFQPSRPVSGAEAVEALDRIQALAGIAGAKSRAR